MNTHDVPEEVYSDAHWLEHVLMNLVSNAIKFSHEGGIYKNIYKKNNSNYLPFKNNFNPNIIFQVSLKYIFPSRKTEKKNKQMDVFLGRYLARIKKSGNAS